MDLLALEISSGELVGAAATALATLAGGVGVIWAWLTSQVTAARAECTTARTEFLAALEKIETRRESTDRAVASALSEIAAILRERGVPARAALSPGDGTHAASGEGRIG